MNLHVNHPFMALIRSCDCTLYMGEHAVSPLAWFFRLPGRRPSRGLTAYP